MCDCFWSGLKSTASAFLVFTLTVTLVAYTATAMTMAISADQSVVGLASIFMTITFVFMMVRHQKKHTSRSGFLGLISDSAVGRLFRLRLQIFSGLLVNLPTIKDWLAWLKYFSIPRYGLAVSQGTGREEWQTYTGQINTVNQPSKTRLNRLTWASHKDTEVRPHLMCSSACLHSTSMYWLVLVGPSSDPGLWTRVMSLSRP